MIEIKLLLYKLNMMNIQNELQFHYKSQTQREAEEKCLNSQISKLEIE